MNATPQERSADPSRQELLRIARGFSCLFWGLPLTLLLSFRAIDIAVVHNLRVPSYLIGVAVLYAGMGLQYYCGVESRRWRRVARTGLFATFLLLYFGPFVYWFSVLPRVGIYFTLNLLLMMAAVMLLFWSASQLSSLAGHMIGDIELAVEARICAWSVVVLMMIPALVLVGFSGYMATRFDSSLVSELQGFRLSIPTWTQVFFLLPMSLTMVAVWKAKERTLRAILSTPDIV